MTQFRVVIQVPAPSDDEFKVLRWITLLMVRALRHKNAPDGVTIRVEREP